jgi:predicted kinase
VSSSQKKKARKNKKGQKKKKKHVLSRTNKTHLRRQQILNPNILVITLNVNRLNSPVKIGKVSYCIMKKKT